MNSRKSCSTHSFFIFRFWVPAGFGINCRYLFCTYYIREEFLKISRRILVTSVMS